MVETFALGGDAPYEGQSGGQEGKRLGKTICTD